MESKRTKEALDLMSPRRCKGVLLLTGTPMKNGKPANLFPLLKAARHPFGDDQRKYEFYFCAGQQKAWGWDATGSSNLNVLNAHTTSHVFRMTKEECLGGELPPRKREVADVPVASRHRTKYDRALRDLAEAYTLQQSSSGGGMGGGPGESNEILAPFNSLRQIGSNAKVEPVVALANRILLEESSVVIFTSFVAVARLVHDRLAEMDWAGELLTGETPPGTRQGMVDRFQSGLSPVMVCTFGAGGVGITLTAACTVVLVDRPWTPGDVLQAEDRIRRIGQKRACRSVWVRAFPLDGQIDALLEAKGANSDEVVDGRGGGGGGTRAAPKVSIRELVETVLSGGGGECSEVRREGGVRQDGHEL